MTLDISKPKLLILRIFLILSSVLSFEKNGRVKSREILERNRMGTDGKYRVFAEAVDRAVLMCNPLKNLPPKTYENWSTMILRFNPEGMMVGE